MSYTMKPSHYLALLYIERERAAHDRSSPLLYERDMDRLMHPHPASEPLAYLRAWGYVGSRENQQGQPMAGTLIPTKDGQRALVNQVMLCESQIDDLVSQCQMKKERYEDAKGGKPSANEYKRQITRWEELRARIGELRSIVFETMPMDAPMKYAAAEAMAEMAARAGRGVKAPEPVKPPVAVAVAPEVAKPAKRKPGRPRKVVVAVDAEPKALR